MPVPKKIGLLQHMGGGNLGDGATLEAVVDNIKRRWPDAVIYGFSMNPKDTQARLGVPSYPIRRQTWEIGCKPTENRVTFKDKVKTAVSRYRFLLRLLTAINTVMIRIPKIVVQELVFLGRSFRILRSLDLLIITGGGQFVESWSRAWKFVGGSWNFPYTVFKWVLLARLAHVKPIILNVGAGPIIRPLSKWFVRGALFFADYVSFRDEQSRALAYQLGFTGKSHVFPDSAYSLDIPAFNTSLTGKRTEPVVGLAPLAYGGPQFHPEHDKTTYDGFIRKLDLFGSWLIRNHYCLTLFCNDIVVDPPAIVDLATSFGNNKEMADACSKGSLCRVHQWTTEELLSNMSSMDYVITCRFHGVIFAHLMNKPVLAISHHPKITTLMNAFGLSEYCVDIDTFDLEQITKTFTRLVDNRDEIKARMAEKVAYYKRKLVTQFDGLFPGGSAFMHAER